MFFFSFSPVSHEVPEDPVLSTVSNHVFEKRLVEKYIAETGTDPINGEPLSQEQLIEIKSMCFLLIVLIMILHFFFTQLLL